MIHSVYPTLLLFMTIATSLPTPLHASPFHRSTPSIITTSPTRSYKHTCTAFEFPTFPSFFQNTNIINTKNNQSLKTQKQQLLNAISNTNNGKTASPQTQQKVLNLVREMELTYPSSPTLLTNPKETQLLDGVWYLQYTSPSKILNANDNDNDDEWVPINPTEGESSIPTNQAQNKGTVSASGFTVDTSNKPVLQIFDISKNQVSNVVESTTSTITVGGSFRPSDSSTNRVVVAFEYGSIDLFGGSIKIPLDGLFSLGALWRGTKDNGWLETTFLDEDMRIGRGNKGTMFVLTRNREDVVP